MTAGAAWIVDVDGQRLRVAERRGAAGRPPLLLVNGIGASLESFEPFVDALDPRIGVIRVDPPGVGGSPLTGPPYRLPGLARRIGGLLDLLGHETFDVLGISWGGALAQQLALTLRRRCRRVVLVATAPGSLMVPAAPHRLRHMLTPRRHRDPAFLREVAGDLYGGTARTDPEAAAAVLALRPGPRSGYLYQLLAAAGWTSLPFLPLLRQPVLVLSGDDDPIVPLINGRILAGLIPHADLHVYPGGHLELGLAPRLLTPAVEQFLTHP